MGLAEGVCVVQEAMTRPAVRLLSTRDTRHTTEGGPPARVSAHSEVWHGSGLSWSFGEAFGRGAGVCLTVVCVVVAAGVCGWAQGLGLSEAF